MIKQLMSYIFVFSLPALAEVPHIPVSMMCSNPAGTLSFTEKHILFGAVPPTGTQSGERVWRYNMLVPMENEWLYRQLLGKETDFVGKDTTKMGTFRFKPDGARVVISDDQVGKEISVQRYKLNPGDDGWDIPKASVTENFICSTTYVTSPPP